MLDTMLFVYFVSLVVMIGVNFISKKLSDPVKIAHYRAALERWKALERKAIETGDEKYLIKYKREEKKMMKIQQELAKIQTPAMLVNMIVMITLFLAMRTFFGNTTVAVLPVDMSFRGTLSWFGQLGGADIPGFAANFIGWYTIVSVSLLPIRKLFGFK